MTLQKTEQSGAIDELVAELELLREENAGLRANQTKVYDYIRAKVNDLLQAVGTSTIKPEELDNQGLIDFDPIGIVTSTFQHVLDSHRKLNQDLHVAHNEIQAIFDSVGTALLVLDPDGCILAYNQKTKDLMLGHHEDVHGRRCHSVVCMQEESKGMTCIFADVMLSQCEQQRQDWILADRNFTVVGRPLFDKNGKISHVVIAYSDITEVKNAELELLQALRETQEANAKIHGILRSASDSLLVTDASDRIVLMNARAEQLFGFCLTKSGEKPLPDILPSRHLANLLSCHPPSGEEVLVEDLSLQQGEGSERIYQARIAVIRGSEGDYRGRITLLHDVTREREVDQMKNDFVSTAAHELRTPLSTILGYTDLLLTQQEQVKDNYQEYLTVIQDKAENLAQIVGDLLDISRIEAGEGLQLSFEPCDLEKLCRQVVNEFSIDNKTHRFSLDFPEHPILIEADRYAIIQVLENIIGNAVKYSPKSGDIEIRARQNDRSCELTINDTGLGMLPDQLDRVFEKFYRADATNTAISGTGLGLTIVKYLVDAHHGMVELESQPGHGTTVRLQLPLTQ